MSETIFASAPERAMLEEAKSVVPAWWNSRAYADGFITLSAEDVSIAAVPTAPNRKNWKVTVQRGGRAIHDARRVGRKHVRDAVRQHFEFLCQEAATLSRVTSARQIAKEA